MRLAALVVLAWGAMAIAPSARAAPFSAPGARSNCTSTTGARAANGGFSDYSGKSCRVGDPAKSGGSSGQGNPAPVTRVVNCGPPRVAGQLRRGPGDVCGPVQRVCQVFTMKQLPTDPTITTTATVQRNGDGSWTLVAVNCAAKNAAPQVTALLVMQQVRKLVPHPKIGVAPPGGATLVNVQTLLWADTPADQPLGTVTLLGHRVALRVHVERVDWDFGDGQSDTTDGPEPKYDPADDCHTVTCPGYWGHVYVATGPMTIAASITWSGQYRIDGGAWQDIPDTVTGPTATAALTVKQARGVLVPNPGEH